MIFNHLYVDFDDDITIVDRIVQDFEIQLYPNPSRNGVFWVDFVDYAESVKIQVFNIQGESIVQIKNVGFHEKIDISNHPKGIYFFNIFYKKKFYTKKVVIN